MRSQEPGRHTKGDLRHNAAILTKTSLLCICLFGLPKVGVEMTEMPRC